MVLKYKLLKDSVSRRFQLLVHKHLTYKHEIQSSAWAVFPSGADSTARTHAALKEHIDFVNSFLHDGKNLFRFQHTLPALEKTTQADLSALHSEFEKMLTLLTFTSTGQQNVRGNIVHNDNTEAELLRLESHLNGVNGKVHSLEHLLRRGKGDSSSWFSVFLYGELPDERIRRYPLREKDYSKFSLGCKWGDLLLGYGTTGKSLWHIYKGSSVPKLSQLVIQFIFLVFCLLIPSSANPYIPQCRQ